MFSFRWIFTTGRLAPQYDYFKCVVNIPEDIPHLDPDDPGEQVKTKENMKIINIILIIIYF